MEQRCREWGVGTHFCDSLYGYVVTAEDLSMGMGRFLFLFMLEEGVFKSPFADDADSSFEPGFKVHK